MAEDTTNQDNLPNSGSSTGKTNSFVKGMVKDYSEIFVPEGVWTNAINAINTSHKGDEGNLGNEQSNKYCVSATYTIIGILHKYRTEWVVFATDDTNSEIGIFDEADCSYTVLVNDRCLNFKKKYLITGAVKYNADCTYSAYWQDNNNPDRTLILDSSRIPYKCTPIVDSCGEENCTTELDCEQLRLHPHVQQPCVTVETAIGSGQLQNGSYQAVIAYSNNGIRLTDYSTPSNPQALWDHSSFGGSLDIFLSNLDPNFEEYELVVISVIANQTVAKKIGNYDISQTKVHLDQYLASLETIPLQLIPLRSQIYEKSKKMFSLNNYLIRTSVTTQPYFNYQPFANKIKVEWVAVQYPADYYWKGGNKTGYMRDEVYPFFIRWVYATGARSASYHIPGRASLPSDVAVLPPTNPDLLPGKDKVWQIYDTSTAAGLTGTLSDGGVIIKKGNMAYWESTERYPDNHPEIWGNLCNQPIRHHKMPSNETIHIHDQAGDKQVINILAVQFNNILHPIDNQGNPIKDIIGYEILRGSREGNRTIVAKGLFNNMLEYDVPGATAGSKKGLIQNYPYNDLRTDPFLSSGITPLRNYFSFNSPEIVFVKPYLGRGVYSKIYKEQYGVATGAYEIPYKHPKFKIITDGAFITASVVALGIALLTVMGKTSTTTTNVGHKISTTDKGSINGDFNGVLPPGDVGGSFNGNIDNDVDITTQGSPINNTSTGTEMSTEGNTGSAISNLVAYINQAFDNQITTGPNSTLTAILSIAAIVTTTSFYWYQATQQLIEIIRKLIPYRNYVLQYNSHGFYNTHGQVSNTNVPLGVNPSFNRAITTGGLKYIGGGVQDFNSFYRINNLFRGKYVCLNLDKNSTLPDITGGNADVSKIHVTTTDPFDIKNTKIASYYGALKLDYENQYGKLSSVVQIPTNSCVYNTTQELNITHFTEPIFGGDVYINRYTDKNPYFFFNTWLIDEPDGTEFNYRNYVNGPKPQYYANFEEYDMYSDFDINLDFSPPSINIETPSDKHHFYGTSPIGAFAVRNSWMYLFNNGVKDFFVESELNMAFRDYGEDDWEKFYDVYGNSFNDLQTMFRSDLISKPIYYKYDLSLSTAKLYNNFISWGLLLPADYDPVLYETCYQYFPYRGIYSLQQQDGLKRDNWRNFLPLNYYTFEGIVTNIKAVNSSGALVLYEDFSPSQFVGVDTLKTDTGGTKITIGDGGLFANNIQSLVNAEDVIEYGASISNRATLNTPYGLFFVSQKAGKVVQYGAEGMNEISKSGMKNWFLQNLPSPLLEAFPDYTEYDNPVAGIGVQAIYDAQYELLYITKRDYKPLDCVGYDPNFGFYNSCICEKVCPEGYTLINGECERTFDTSVCEDPTYAYNPITGQCEKIISTDLCPVGYTYTADALPVPICTSTTGICDTDIVIIMDNSSSMTTTEMNQLNAFVDNIVSNLTSQISVDSVRIGIVKFTDCAGIITNLTSNITSITNAINSPRYPINNPDFNTNYFEALCKGVQVLQGANNRPAGNKKIIFVTDGQSNVYCNTIPTCWQTAGYNITFPLPNGSIAQDTQVILDFSAYLKNTLGYDIILGVLGDDCEREKVLRSVGGGVLNPSITCTGGLPAIPTVNYPMSSVGAGLYGHATYEADFDTALSIVSDIVAELQCTNTTPPIDCTDEDCTLNETDNTCDCIYKQDPSCSGEIVNIGNDVWVCRQVDVQPTVDCSIVTCNEAQGYTYNSITNKCEKIVTSPPCAGGYVFNTETQECEPPAIDPVPMCPEGSVYNFETNTCTTLELSSAIENTTTACKADIIILLSVCPGNNPSVRRKPFIDRLIDNISAGLDNSVGDYRVQVMTTTHTPLRSAVQLYSGSTGFQGQSGFVTNASDYFKSFSYNPTGTCNQSNAIYKGLTDAANALYTANSRVNGDNTLPRTGVRKIIILVTDTPDWISTAPASTPSFNGCFANNSANYPVPPATGHYPNTFAYVNEMRIAVNQAKCLLQNNPALEIFVASNGIASGSLSLWGGTTVVQQYYDDLKSAGTVYNIDNSNAVTLADKLYDDIIALQAEPGAPAVCSETTVYSCPQGCTLVNTNQCSCEVSTPPEITCDPSCDIVADGDNANCVCSISSVPNQCGDCDIVDDLCSCLVQVNPTVTPIRTPISLEDPKFFEKIEWTVSYDPKNKMWLSFHDWHPSLMIPSYNHFFTIKDNGFWKHNERFDSFTNYYNIDDADLTKDYGWEVEYNIVTPNQITTLRSIEYYMEAYKYYNDGKDMFHILDENFDRAIVYNSEQVSPLLALKLKDKNSPLQPLQYPIVSAVNTQILASKEENKYRFNNFYDITKDRHEFPSSNPIVPMFVTAPDGYHKNINAAYVDVFKPATEHKKFRHFGNKIILRKTQSGDKKMLLKLVNSKMLNSPR
jgi:hypothetical protein